MSGGHWNYGQCNLGDDMFPGCDVCYGLGDDGKSKYGNYTESIKEARRANPMRDKQLSELVFDVLCLIYSCDWYISGDTGADTYREDVNYFKTKWLGKPEETTKEEIDKSVEELRDELYVSFGLKEVEE